MAQISIVQELKTRSAEVNSNLSEICREAGVNRATVERWKDTPKTIEILRKIESTIEKRRKKLNLA